MTIPKSLSSRAEFSADKRYRYALHRDWEPAAWEETVAFVGLNPSTADETQDDPTIRRCIGFAHQWGFKSLVMLNLFAFRATDPKVMKAEAQPIGHHNDGCIRWNAGCAGLVVACWGVHGSHLDRASEVRSLLRGSGTQLKVFGLTKDGHPKHPLYLAKTTQLEEWN